MGKVILLGGCPRTGKTILSTNLVKSGKPFSRLSGDMLDSALGDTMPHKFDFFKKVIARLVEDSEVYAINSVLDYCSYDFELDDIRTLPFLDKLDMYFFGFPEISAEEIEYAIKHYAKPTDWIYQVNDDYLSATAKRIYDFNRVLKEWCAKYGYRFVDMGVGAQRDRALNSLYEEIINASSR